ncbi:UDP-glycosyltransferase 82A1 [Dichanthelium oligosanthes]|uniref:Glycosyltransferase n=1 Tax=Dichanthelium oligosanthes TaxID=888268 RepID=A0A1E5VZ63_9POAL|nr:UDP-glycosyltransferase 82A1 [Dichanthelium oligosanthes]
MGAEAVTHPGVLLVPFPAQGHITPMLRLARALAAHGVVATVAVPDFIHRRIASAGGGGAGVVALASIPSGIAEDAGGGSDTTPEFGAIVHAMEDHMPPHLERMLTSPRRPVACVVVDVLASWAVPVAARCGVPAAGFWPAMLASYRVVAAIPELIERGLISESGTPISSSESSDDGDEQDGDHSVMRGLKMLPAQVELRAEELPWLIGDSATQRSRFDFWLQTLHRARGFRWVLVNSFPGESGCAAAADDVDVHRLAMQGPQVLPVGSALLPGSLSSAAAAERTKHQQQQQPCVGNNNGDKNSSMWRADSTCIGWLDAQRAGSVVYVSFGSWVGSIGPDKVRELALGLEATGRPFLWALKRDPSWRAGLPEGFAARVAAAGRGKVVDWAPQDDVLRHAAVGCYLTHCGWNSTLEAVRHGVPLLCYPVSGDQFINCAYMTGPWGIGLRLGAELRRDDVRGCIGRVMDGGGEGRRLREKVRALRERVVAAEARRAADRNVRSFVDEIRRDRPLLMQIYSVL